MKHQLPVLLLAACSYDPTKGDTATETGATTDSTAPTGPEDWTAGRACGSIRLFVTTRDRGLALESRADVVGAVLDQAVLQLDLDFALDDVYGVVQDGMTEGDVCGSIEEFPPASVFPYWLVTGGTAHLEFTPESGLDPEDMEWTYDGTEVGTLQVELRDLVLTPMGGAPPAEVPDLDLELPLTSPDLPA